MIRDRSGPADRAEVDCVVMPNRLEPVLRHHPSVLRVVVAAPGQIVPGERDAVLGCDRFEHAQAFGHDFLANTVTRDDGDAIAFVHGDEAKRAPANAPC
jgi:hypothetical protein